MKYKDIVNFSEGPEFPAPDSSIAVPRIPDLTIQEDDLISIRVTAFSMEAAAPFNIDAGVMMGNAAAGGAAGGGGGGAQQGTSRPMIGYLVDKEGYIDFPVVGRLKLSGLTTSEVKDLVTEKLKPYLNDPVVLVRFVNFQISVFGEVTNPGNYILPNERISVLDAISGAGDVTAYANRRNILVVRDYDGKRQFGRINLQDRNVFNSPYFYLKQNDVLYVEPLPIRVASTQNQASRILPWLSIVTSLTTLTLTLVNLNRN